MRKFKRVSLTSTMRQTESKSVHSIPQQVQPPRLEDSGQVKAVDAAKFRLFHLAH